MLQIMASLMIIIYEDNSFIIQATGVFVLGKTFQPNLMFANKASITYLTKAKCYKNILQPQFTNVRNKLECSELL